MAVKVDGNQTKFTLDEKDIPTKWYNIQADFKAPASPIACGGPRRCSALAVSSIRWACPTLP